jgi:hypothetical protein
MACKLRIKFPRKDVSDVLWAFGIEPDGEKEAQERQLRLIFDNVELEDRWCFGTATRAKGGFCTELSYLASEGIIFFGERKEDGMKAHGVFCLGGTAFGL